MSRPLTMRDLDNAGADAGALLDAAERELERAIPMAASRDDRKGLADDLRQLRKLRAEWFA